MSAKGRISYAGLSIEQILEARTEDDGECRVWTGPKAGGRPTLKFDNFTSHPLSHLHRSLTHEVPGRTQTWVPKCGNRLCVLPAHNELLKVEEARKRRKAQAAAAALPAAPEGFVSPTGGVVYPDGLRTVSAALEYFLGALAGDSRVCEACKQSSEWFFHPDVLQICRHCIDSNARFVRKLSHQTQEAKSKAQVEKDKRQRARANKERKESWASKA